MSIILSLQAWTDIPSFRSLINLAPKVKHYYPLGYSISPPVDQIFLHVQFPLGLTSRRNLGRNNLDVPIIELFRLCDFDNGGVVFRYPMSWRLRIRHQCHVNRRRKIKRNSRELALHGLGTSTFS